MAAETELGSSVLRAGSKLLTSLQRGMQAFNLGCDVPALDLRPSSLIASCGLGKQMVFLDSTSQFSITAFFSFLPKKRIKFEPQQSNKSFGASIDTSIPEALCRYFSAKSIIPPTRGKKKRCADHFV